MFATLKAKIILLLFSLLIATSMLAQDTKNGFNQKGGLCSPLWNY